MWIELDRSVSEYISGLSDATDEGLLAVEELFQAMRKKQHIVFAKRGTLEELFNNDLISRGNREYIQTLIDHYIDIYAVKSSLKHRINVRANTDQFTNEEGVFTVPLKSMVDIQRSRLLVENESDGALYKDICSYLMSEKGLDRVYGICFENDSFSGSGADRKIEELSINNRIMLCIIDSDKNYPEGKSGSSSQSASRCYEGKKDHKLIYFYELQVREKENLLSPEMYQSVNEEELKLISILKKYPSEYLFFDFKDGVKHKRFKDQRWMNHYSHIVEECKENGLYIENDNEEDQFIHIKGIGGKQAQRVDELLLAPESVYRNGIDILSRMHHYSLSPRLEENIRIMRNDFYKTLSTEIVKEWENIYDYMFSVGCSLIDNPGVMASNSSSDEKVK